MGNRIIEKIQNVFRKKEDEIEPNIMELPDKIGKYKVIMQYTPPKGLSPNEVGFLYYRKFQSTDLDAMLYEWAHRGYISIKNFTTHKSITNIKTLNSDKDYEQYCWHMFFGYKEGEKRTLSFKNISSFIYGDKIGEKILNYCKGKGWLTYEVKNYLSGFLAFLWFGIPLVFLGFVLSSLAVDGSIIGGFIFLIFASFVLYKIVTKNRAGIRGIKKIKLTDEGEKLLAHIYGYKYYLEKCEEEQFKKLMEDDPTFLDKTLPYIIALRLNPYFLKNQSILHYEYMSSSEKIKIYIFILLLMIALILWASS